MCTKNKQTYEETCLDIINEERKIFERLIANDSKKKQEQHILAFEKICEIQDISERTFVVLAFVGELKRTKEILKDLLQDDT